jgi:hypothetical protein
MAVGSTGVGAPCTARSKVHDECVDCAEPVAAAAGQ